MESAFNLDSALWLNQEHIKPDKTVCLVKCGVMTSWEQKAGGVGGQSRSK